MVSIGSDSLAELAARLVANFKTMNRAAVIKMDSPLIVENLLDFLNRLNEEWEIATRRLSPNVLVRLIS